MKHAFLILAHKNPQQLSDLIQTLDHANYFFLVHIDKKTNIESFLTVIPEKHNIRFVNNRIAVNWGGFSQIEATLSLIAAIFEDDLEVDYVHLLSGQDYPICTNEEIYTIFLRNKGKNFIEHYRVPHGSMGLNMGIDHIKYVWDIDGKGFKACRSTYETDRSTLDERDFLKDSIPYGGSQWWSLHMDCIKYIHETCVPGNKFYDFYKYTFIPDEMFFQTVIMNSPFKKYTVNENYRFHDWSKGGGHPAIITKDHYFQLINSNKLFARKFDPEIDSTILSYMKMLIEKKSKRLLK